MLTRTIEIVFLVSATIVFAMMVLLGYAANHGHLGDYFYRNVVIMITAVFVFTLKKDKTGLLISIFFLIVAAVISIQEVFRFYEFMTRKEYVELPIYFGINLFLSLLIIFLLILRLVKLKRLLSG